MISRKKNFVLSPVLRVPKLNQREFGMMKQIENSHLLYTRVHLRLRKIDSLDLSICILRIPPFESVLHHQSFLLKDPRCHVWVYFSRSQRVQLSLSQIAENHEMCLELKQWFHHRQAKAPVVLRHIFAVHKVFCLFLFFCWSFSSSFRPFLVNFTVMNTMKNLCLHFRSNRSRNLSHSDLFFG